MDGIPSVYVVCDIALSAFNIGGPSFLLAFASSEVYDDGYSEVGLNAEQLVRVQNGKRMRAVKVIAKDPLPFVAKSLATLIVARPLDSWIHLMIRDVGPMRYFDWRSRARSVEPVSDGDWPAESMNDVNQAFEPTLTNLYKDDLAPLRRLESSLVRIVGGYADLASPSDAPAIDFLAATVGTSTRGGPPGGPRTPGLSLVAIASMLRTLVLAAYADVHVRFRCFLDSYPPRLVALVAPQGTDRRGIDDAAVREFASLCQCCVGKSFGAQLLPAFKHAVATADASRDGQLDYSELVDEIDVLKNYGQS